MKPFFIIGPPRNKGSLLMRMLDATPGVRCAGESSAMLAKLRELERVEIAQAGKAAEESWPMHRHHAVPRHWHAGIARLLREWALPEAVAAAYGCRVIFLGREGWESAVDWWSWLQDTWEDARLIFLGRDQGEIELSMMMTRSLWRPAYGTCAGHCGGRVHNHLQSMRDYHAMNPGTTALLDAADLGDFDKLAGELDRIGIPLDRGAWESELAIVSGRGRDLSLALDAPPVPAEAEDHPAFREGATIGEIVGSAASILWVAAVGAGGDAWRASAEIFAAAGATVWLMVYDDSDPGFPGASRVIRASGGKFQIALLHLKPGEVASFDFIFLWDDDVLARADFDPRRFVGLMASYDLDAAQPAITGHANHGITRPVPGGEGRLTTFVEIMCPAFSRSGWERFHAYLEPGNRSGWGYDHAPVGRKGIIDCMTAEHTRPPRSDTPEAREEMARFLGKYGLVPAIEVISKLEAPSRELEAWKADPFGDKANALPEDYAPKPPRKFKEHAARHERAIVFPWLSTAAVWEELRYSLRSIEANFADRECPIYILGDRRPEWLAPGGRVIFERMEGYERSRRRGLFQAFELGLQLAGEVCWMNDDIYFLRNTSWKHLRVALTEGELTQRAVPLMEAPNIWKRGLGAAVADLRAYDRDLVMRFATHTPFLFEREKSLEIFRRFHLPYKGGWATLYHNWHRTRHRPCGKLKATRLPAPAKARFLNHNDHNLTPELKEGIRALFPAAAPWEIRIPRRIHQTWATGEIPRDIYPARWTDSWRQLHPEWEYRLWTDEDLKELADSFYPAFSGLMRNAPGVIKADVGRLLVLHRHGGLYADLDYQALKPMDELVDGGTCFVCTAADGYTHNALIAAAPGVEMLIAAARAALARWKSAPHMSPEWISGPVLFTEVSGKHHPDRWTPAQVCPIDWRSGRRAEDELNAAEEFPDAHAVTFWRHNW